MLTKLGHNATIWQAKNISRLWPPECNCTGPSIIRPQMKPQMYVIGKLHKRRRLGLQSNHEIAWVWVDLKIRGYIVVQVILTACVTNVTTYSCWWSQGLNYRCRYSLRAEHEQNYLRSLIHSIGLTVYPWHAPCASAIQATRHIQYLNQYRSSLYCQPTAITFY